MKNISARTRKEMKNALNYFIHNDLRVLPLNTLESYTCGKIWEFPIVYRGEGNYSFQVKPVREPILAPDTTNEDPKYWEKVLATHGLDMREGEPPQVYAGNGVGSSARQLSQVLYIGGLNNLVGKELTQQKRKLGKIRRLGAAPDA